MQARRQSRNRLNKPVSTRPTDRRGEGDGGSVLPSLVSVFFVKCESNSGVAVGLLWRVCSLCCLLVCCHSTDVLHVTTLVLLCVAMCYSVLR